MNLKEIAIFKRFMAQHELRKNFIKKYRKSVGLTRNPESIEQYFSNVEAESVISSAVKNFVAGEAMGYDFWQSVNISWLSYLHKMQASYSVEQEDVASLRGFFSCLRENWDKEKPWVYDPISVAKIRCGLASPADAYVEEETEPQVVEQNETVVEEGDDPLADFDFLDMPTPLNIRLKSGEVSLNFNNGAYKITFNKVASKVLEEAGMTFVRLAKNKSGDICLILNRREGARLSKSRYSNNGQMDNITINSKEITTKLRTLLNIRSDYSVLNIQQLTTTQDYIIYKLTRQ